MPGITRSIRSLEEREAFREDAFILKNELLNSSQVEAVRRQGF